MAYFPLFVNLEGASILVVGGGRIAERRIGALLEFGCQVMVIAPEITNELDRLSKKGTVFWVKDRYSVTHLKRHIPEQETDWMFVLAAAEESVNAEVVRDCKRMGIPVNNASRKEDCDFYFPGLIKEQEVVIGVTSGGGDHKYVAALTKRIRELVQRTWQV